MRIRLLLFTACWLTVALLHAGNATIIKTVVIDAGHGGKDPGASGPGKTNEKDVALAVALKVGDFIQKNYPDVKVIFTRKTDVFIELRERADIANKAKADLFIAVHCNSSPNSEVLGTSTYVLGLHRTEANLEVAKRENAVILLEDDHDKNYEFDPNSPEGHIIMSMKQNAFLDQSIDMASKTETEYKDLAKRKSLGVKQAGFYVLYRTTMPSMLSEIGFISNPEEEKFLNSAKGQEQIANSIFNAFMDYKTGIEGSEGEQFLYQEAKKKAEDEAKNQAKNAPAVKNEPKEEPVAEKAETKSEIPPVKKEEAPVKTEVKQEPVAEKAEVKKEPVAEKKETAPVAEEKAAPKKTEPKPAPAEKTTEVKEEKSNAVAEKKAAEPQKKEVKAEQEKKVSVASTKTEGGVVFKVQLFAIKGAMKPTESTKVNKLFDDITTEDLPNGLTRYFAGSEASYAAVKAVLAKAKGNGYPDAFVVGYKNGTRLDNNQLKAYEGH